MKRYKSSSRHMATAGIAAVVLVLTGSVLAQQATVDDVLRADQKRLKLAQASQERVNDTNEAARSLTDQYRSINKEVDCL